LKSPDWQYSTCLITERPEDKPWNIRG